MSAIRFWIDPRFQINYSSYYIHGIIDTFGKKSIRFMVLDGVNVRTYDDFRKGVALIFETEGNRYKVFIDSWDSDSIHPEYYNWCDVYAKVNVRSEDLCWEKLLAIGPSFGIQLWNPVETLLIGIRNYFRANKANGVLPSFRTYMMNYAYTFVRRLRYRLYRNEGSGDRDYLFAYHTLWYDKLTDSTTNNNRASFIRLCKKIFPRFEGGMLYLTYKSVVAQFPKYRNYLAEYKDIIVEKRISLSDYLKKTKKSALVFNTPSVEGCLGWKLGEYLTMGKAIISTSLNHVMPGDFKDGIHYLEVDGIENLEAAIERIRLDDSLRQSLSVAASQYFEEYLSPKAVVSRIIAKAVS